MTDSSEKKRANGEDSLVGGAGAPRRQPTTSAETRDGRDTRKDEKKRDGAGAPRRTPKKSKNPKKSKDK